MLSSSNLGSSETVEDLASPLRWAGGDPSLLELTREYTQSRLDSEQGPQTGWRSSHFLCLLRHVRLLEFQYISLYLSLEILTAVVTMWAL